MKYINQDNFLYLSINNHIYINVDSLIVSSSKPEVVKFAKL